MKTINDLFNENKIRSLWDATSRKWWFSVIDICAALKDCDYQTARNYWKWLKSKWMAEGNQLVSVTNQLMFPAADGKLYFTEAMDIKGILRLILAFPSPKAEPYRIWLADKLAENDFITEQFATAGAKFYDKSKKEIENKIAGDQVLLKTTTVKEVILQDSHSPL